MALVTSVTIGALFMGMAEFSTTVNRESQNSAREAGLDGAEETSQKEDAAAKQKKTEAETAADDDDEKPKNEWRFRRAEDRKVSDE